MTMRMIIGSALVTAGLCVGTLGVGAAQAPSTDVFLAPLVWTNSSVTVGTPVNISNNPGYDNQPSFLPDSSAVIFASNRDGKQNDIYKYDVASKALVQLTKTDENEYSPLVALDGKSFLTVHGTEQSIFRYDMDGGNPRLAFQYGAQLIGYHVWTSPTEFAAFILAANGAPQSLQVINTTTGKGEIIETNTGRSLLQRIGHHTISFVSKADRENWMIKEFDITTHKVVPIMPAVKGSEDLTWLPDGRIVMASGSKLFVSQDFATWTELADLTAVGIKRITRLAASRDGKNLAIVGEQ